MLQNLISLSLTGSIVIILIILLKKFSKQKYTSKLSYFLWIILAIRLLLPIDIPLPINIQSFDSIVHNTSINHQLNAIDNQTNLSTVNTRTVQSNTNHNINNTNSNTIDSNNTYIQNNTNTTDNINLPNYTIKKIKTNNENVFKLNTNIILNIWIIGMVISFIYYVTLQLYFLRNLYKSKSNINDVNRIFMQSIVNDLCKDLNIMKQPDVYFSDKIATPMLINPLKPTIFIPSSLANHNDIELMLEHELIHYKKKHLALKCLVLSANIVHWFNPMMYLMMKSFNEDCELVCDEILLNNKDKEFRQSYGKAILNSI